MFYYNNYSYYNYVTADVGNVKVPVSFLSIHSDVIKVYLMSSSSGMGIPVAVSCGSKRQ